MDSELFQSLKKLSERNPNPIFNVNREGFVLHTNPACVRALGNWNLAQGDPVPEVLTGLIDSAFVSACPQKQSLPCANGLYDFEVIPMSGFALVHGFAPKNSQEKRLRDIKRLDTFLLSEKKNGDSFPIEINISEMVWDGKSEFIGIVRDITQRKQMEEKLHNLVTLDGLTGIGNRRLFDETLDTEWKRAVRDQLPLSLIMLDIDFFRNGIEWQN